VSVEQIVGWPSGLDALPTRIAPHFARPEARVRAGRSLDVIGTENWALPRF
jgi:hypothetical protein